MMWVYLNKMVLPITETDTTWRRGCVTGTGMDLVSDLETQRLPAPDTIGEGCEYLQSLICTITNMLKDVLMLESA